jgi:hypothetical protein
MRANRLEALAAVVATGLSCPPAALAQEQAARAYDVMLEREGDHARVVVLLDAAVRVVEQAGPARISFRLLGARASGRRRPVIEPDEDGPIVRVALVPAGPDLELSIDVRRSVAVRHVLTKTVEGFELRVDLAEVAPKGRAPAAAVPPPAPVPPPAARPVRPSPAAAPPAPPASEGRVLGGHVFLTPAGFASPFVDTRCGITLGFVHAAFPAVDARDGSRYTAQLGAPSVRAHLAVRLFSRLGLVASGGGTATLGMNEASALNRGADGAGTWMVGLQGIVARLERTGTQVAARISAEGSAGGSIGALAPIFATPAAAQVPSFSTFTGSLASTAGRVQWTAAQAIGSYASAQASLGWTATWTSPSSRPTEHALDVTGGVALTLDAMPWFPLAVLVEHDGDAVLTRSGARSAAPSAVLSTRGTSGLVAGIYYSGRRDLLLGALGGVVTRGDGPAQTKQQASVTLEYFF